MHIAHGSARGKESYRTILCSSNLDWGLTKRRLFDEGVYALPIVFPMVAKDKARLRTMINADHTKEELDFAIEKIEKIGKELQLIK